MNASSLAIVAGALCFSATAALACPYGSDHAKADSIDSRLQAWEQENTDAQSQPVASNVTVEEGFRIQVAGDAPCNPKVTVCDD